MSPPHRKFPKALKNCAEVIELGKDAISYCLVRRAPRQTLAAPASVAFHCSAESRVGPYQMHFGPPALPTRGRRVAIVRAITPPPRGACSIGR
mgnify:FL=1